MSILKTVEISQKRVKIQRMLIQEKVSYLCEIAIVWYLKLDFFLFLSPQFSSNFEVQ